MSTADSVKETRWFIPMYCVWGKELEVISPSLFTWSLFIELNGETCEVTSLPLGSSLSRGYFCSFRQTGPITFEVCNAVGPSSTRMPSGLRREATPDRVRSGLVCRLVAPRRGWYLDLLRGCPRTSFGVGSSDVSCLTEIIAGSR